MTMQCMNNSIILFYHYCCTTHSVKEDRVACNEWKAAMERTERLAERRALEEGTRVVISTFVHGPQILLKNTIS